MEELGNLIEKYDLDGARRPDVIAAVMPANGKG